MAKVLITGSFDPITVGHFALIEKAAQVFDEVTVCIFVNPDKEYCFSKEERLMMIRAGVCELGLSNVIADASDGFVADYARDHGIRFVLRGVRNEEDMVYEMDMARYNHKRNPELETLFWISGEEFAGVSSTAVRKSLETGRILSGMLLSSTAELIRQARTKELSTTEPNG